MSNKLNIILLIFSALTIQGCATYSAPHDELISKALTPPSGQALIYIIRASGHKGRLRAIPFTFNQEKIGDIWADQYLYVHANPMQILLPQADGSTYKLNILANRTYYLLYGFEGSFFDAVLDPFTWEKLHFNVLSSREGRELINEYRLSGEFRRVIIGYSAASTINNKNMSTTSYETNAYDGVFQDSCRLKFKIMPPCSSLSQD